MNTKRNVSKQGDNKVIETENVKEMNNSCKDNSQLSLKSLDTLELYDNLKNSTHNQIPPHEVMFNKQVNNVSTIAAFEFVVRTHNSFIIELHL